MSSSRLAERLLDFPEAAARCRTLPALRTLAAETVAECGITVIASGMLTGPRVERDEVLHFHTWPDQWLDHYRARNFMDCDPLPRWALVSGAPALWTDIVACLPATDPGHVIRKDAARFGWRQGVVVPVRTLHGQLGLVSVGGPAPRIAARDFQFLVAVCTATLFRADAIDCADQPAPPHFSRREQECVSLLVQGLTEREISARLGIKEVTARFHLDNARLKTGARSRTHLAGIAGNWLGKRHHFQRAAKPPLDSER
jgi:LuxR family quorum sensing-dependent transcriptional regulator